MEFPVDGILGIEVKSVVHPPHVPFHAEAQSTKIGRLRYTRPRCRFLSNGQHAWVVMVDHLIKCFQEIYGLKVLVAAILVGYPLTLFAGIVEIEHRCHGINPQPVYVVFLKPEKGIRDEIIFHLVPSVIEYKCPPLPVLPLLWVRMFVETCPVEKTQTVGILGEMSGYPVNDDADAVLMASVYEKHKVFRLAEPARRCIIAECLISPGSIERMFGYRQQLDMSKSEFFNICNEFFGQFPICKKSVSVSHP